MTLYSEAHGTLCTPYHPGLPLIVPLRALQATPRVDVSADKAKALTERIQDAGTEVVKAKACSSRHVASALPCSWLSCCRSLSGGRCMWHSIMHVPCREGGHSGPGVIKHGN